MATNWIYTDFNGVREMPSGKGVYVFKVVDNPEDRIVYIGKSINLKARINTHRQQFLKNILSDIVKEGRLVICYCLCEEYSKIEKAMIRMYTPYYNTLDAGWFIPKHELLKPFEEFQITEP